jgi:hypothetical protein
MHLIWMMLTFLKPANKIFTREAEQTAQHMARVKQL